MFRIGEFSKLGKTTIKTLRYYDHTGLLQPEGIDPFTGYRLYTTQQLLTLHTIQSLRQIGFSLSEIKDILAGKDPRPILEHRRAEILEQLSETAGQLSRIDFILQGKQEENYMNYAATIKQLPECIVYSKKLIAPSYDSYFELIPAIGAQVSAKYPDLQCTAPEYCFMVYLDGEYKEKDIHVEFCEAVNEMKPDFEDIVFKRMEPVTALSVMHKGSYDGLRQAYAFAFDWIEKNGYHPVSSPRENYIDGIWNKEQTEDWLTELQIPVAKN